MRTLGVTDTVSGAPDVVVALFAALTQFGDAWFLFLSLSLLYWLAPDWLAPDARRVAALLVAFGLAAAMLTLALKTAFALPRPPGATAATPPAWLPAAGHGLFARAATGDGFGFPSGHALGTTVVYGGLAALATAGDRTRRLLAAGLVVALVALSRLVLGVHFLADVVVGIGIGLGLLWAALRISDRDPTRAFGLAAVLGVAALGATVATGHLEHGADAAAGFGGALGGLLGWGVVERRTAERSGVGPVAQLSALLVAGGLWVVATEASLPLPLTAAVDLLAVSVVVALPALVDAVER
jgi:membrane-associated phospholipid phosphatase